MELESLKPEEYKHRADIIQKTVDQIIKDCGTFGIEIGFSGFTEWAYDELFDQLEDQVADMLSGYPEKLWALLYHIDVSDKSIQQASSEHTDWSYEAVVTELILYRELKKVITREYIKQNPDWLNE